MKKINTKSYLRLMEKWVKSAEKYFCTPKERPDLLIYGTGTNSWGVQTQQKAFANFAILAADPELDEKNAGSSRENMLDQALKMLRFNLESHIEGNYQCTDGTSWGHTWISALGIERMMHAVSAIENHLTDNDRKLLKKILISESDWLLYEYQIVAGTVKNNKPESNLWNGAILHRTATMYPNAPNAAKYRDKGSRFLINSISVASDQNSKAVVDGKKVKDCYVGDNFFETYACNHHGYLNVGYMVICLSNTAMLHFWYKEKGLKPPEALYHHVKDLWKLVKKCIFPDGRLLRIGGDTRVRYCYCQDYLIPSLLMMNDLLDETECIEWEKNWLAQVAKEQKLNKDGGFLSDRAQILAQKSPLYYTRLESDRAASLSMAAYWRRVFDFPETGKAVKDKKIFQWHDPYHGACFIRGKRRMASWVWRAAELPQGLCLSPSDSSMAEWYKNLSGEIHGTGKNNDNKLIEHYEDTFAGGFVTSGTINLFTNGMLAEGVSEDTPVVTKIVYAALPDDCTVIVMQQAKTLKRCFLTRIQGIFLNVPNDLFNNNNRSIYTKNGKQVIKRNRKEKVINLKSKWVNIDNSIGIKGIYGIDSLKLYCPGERNIAIRNKTAGGGFLYSNQICSPCVTTTTDFDADEILFDLGAVVQAGVGNTITKKTETYDLNPESENNIRACMVNGKDGNYYLIAANFGKEKIKADLKASVGKQVKELSGSKTAIQIENQILRLELIPGKTRFFKIGV